MTPDRSHYRKTSPTTVIDVYRVLQLFDVADPCIQHAVKKLLAAGKRGAKDAAKDVAEAIESLQRWQEMRREEAQEEIDHRPPPIELLQTAADLELKASRDALRGSTF